nr:MAG TPA: hypothetical protein [Caudoviricetes sp.]
MRSFVVGIFTLHTHHSSSFFVCQRFNSTRFMFLTFTNVQKRGMMGLERR